MKIFRFVKKVIFLGLTFLSNFTNALNAISLDCISMKNQECKTSPKVINIYSNNPVFYPFRIKIIKCSGNCNNINNLYAKNCFSDVMKDFNVKVFNLMSRTNETRLFVIINKDGIKINVENCKELIDKGICDKGFIWNPSNCECECDKNCDFSEYLDYENCKCRKKLVDKLIDECTETIEEVKLANITIF